MRISQAITEATADLKHNWSLDPETANAEDFLNPLFWGQPGIGKSSIARSIADALEVDFAWISLTDIDPADMGGFPLVIEEYNPATKQLEKVMKRCRPHYLKQDGKGILCIEEIGQATTMCKNILAQLVHDRVLGDHQLGVGWQIIGCTNDIKDKAGTSPMPTQLLDRFDHMEIELDVEDSIKYMLEHNYVPELPAYFRFRPEYLAKLDAKQKASPSPRSWAKVNHKMKWDLSDKRLMTALKGLVGESAALDFIGFKGMYDALPDPEAPFNDPDTATIPEKGNVLCALVSSLAYKVTNKTASNFLRYLDRIERDEIKIWACRDATNRDKSLLKSKNAISDYMINEARFLLLD